MTSPATIDESGAHVVDFDDPGEPALREVRDAAILAQARARALGYRARLAGQSVPAIDAADPTSPWRRAGWLLAECDRRLGCIGEHADPDDPAAAARRVQALDTLAKALETSERLPEIVKIVRDVLGDYASGRPERAKDEGRIATMALARLRAMGV